MAAILDHGVAWLVCLAAQAIILGIGHVIVKGKYLNYWLAASAGVGIWLLPLLLTVLSLGLDPRPTLFIIGSAIAMFSVIALESRARREEVRCILFYTVTVLAISFVSWVMSIWIALVPLGTGWIEQSIMGMVGICVCGLATIFMHYADMIGGLDIYHQNGLTPGERQTISDAMYIIDRKIRPHVGTICQRMKRASEALSQGIANIESVDTFLALLMKMLEPRSQDQTRHILIRWRRACALTMDFNLAKAGNRNACYNASERRP